MIKGQAEKVLNEVYEHLDILLAEKEMYLKMLSYAGKYEISIQYWGESNTNVFIEKDGIELTSFGGLNPSEAIEQTVIYLDRINQVK